MANYQDDAVLIPGRGAVLIAPVGTAAPTSDAIEEWVADGATGPLGSFNPLGYTSEDDLPKFDSKTDGGDKKGAWENDSLRMTKTKITESLTVTAIQWSEDPLKHYFGPGKVVTADGRFEFPDVYTSTEVSMLVLMIDGHEVFGFHYSKVASSPGDSIELDPEKFAGMPILYTIMGMAGQPKGSLIAGHLKTASSGSSGGLGTGA